MAMLHLQQPPRNLKYLHLAVIEGRTRGGHRPPRLAHDRNPLRRKALDLPRSHRHARRLHEHLDFRGERRGGKPRSRGGGQTGVGGGWSPHIQPARWTSNARKPRSLDTLPRTRLLCCECAARGLPNQRGRFATYSTTRVHPIQLDRRLSRRSQKRPGTTFHLPSNLRASLPPTHPKLTNTHTCGGCPIAARYMGCGNC